MKRSQDFSAGASSTPKRLKTTGEPLSEHGQAQPDGEEWTKVERRKAKKMKKTEERLEVAHGRKTVKAARFMYVPREITKKRHAVSIDDIRDLVLYLVADAPPPTWLRVENNHSIQKVVALLIPGLTPTLLSLPPLPTSATANPNLPLSIPLPSSPSDPSPIPFIASTFSHACPTRAPGEKYRMHSVLGSFFNGPTTGVEKKKRMTERLTSERTLGKDPARYLLTLEQMIENEYPIPSYMADVFEKPPGWVETPQNPDSSDKSPQKAKPKYMLWIARWCCLTEDGKELARICIIDYHSGIVVYDQLVKPPKPITDYLTRWSGITEAALASVTTALPTVQKHLLQLLSVSPTPILLGHSLESDLKALKICHPLCIDTAVVYHHPRGRPLKPGLAWLTKKWCGREIQIRGEGGHDPEEDARACLDLLKKKVQNGPGFGEFKTDMESIFERMTRSVGQGGPGSVRSAVVDYGNPAAMHGSKATTNYPCKTDDDVLEGLLQVVGSHQFAFGRFTALAEALGWTTPKASLDSTPSQVTPRPEADEATLTTILNTLNTHLTKLHASLPPRTAFLIFTGHSDPRHMTALNARKTAFDQAVRGGKTPEDIDRSMWWTTEDDRELEDAVEVAKRGLLFLAIK